MTWYYFVRVGAHLGATFVYQPWNTGAYTRLWLHVFLYGASTLVELWGGRVGYLAHQERVPWLFIVVFSPLGLLFSLVVAVAGRELILL